MATIETQSSAEKMQTAAQVAAHLEGSGITVIQCAINCALPLPILLLDRAPQGVYGVSRMRRTLEGGTREYVMCARYQDTMIEWIVCESIPAVEAPSHVH